MTDYPHLLPAYRGHAALPDAERIAWKTMSAGIISPPTAPANQHMRWCAWSMEGVTDRMIQGEPLWIHCYRCLNTLRWRAAAL